MRRNTRSLVEIASQTLRLPEPIVEIGSYQVAGQEAAVDLRPLFRGREFIGCDQRPGPGVDRVEDVHALSFGSGSAGTVIMLDTLEHVRDCHRAMAEVYRVLKPDGVAIATSVMDFFIHEYPSDYWRFTPEAFKLLFRPFGQYLVGFQGNPEKPHTVFAIGVKQPSQDYAAAFAAIERAYRRRNSTAYWRAAQVYYAVRDLAANLRGRNNAFGFQVVTAGTGPAWGPPHAAENIRQPAAPNIDKDVACAEAPPR